MLHLHSSRSTNRIAAFTAMLLVAAACTSQESTSEDSMHADRIDTADMPPKPNMILLISDDLGWPYYGFMGSKTIKTPNLDRLADQSTLFLYGFTTSSICSPSHNSLLTGLHPAQWKARVHRLRMLKSPSHALPLLDPLPTLLASAGYASFQAGKYWVDTYERAGFTRGTRVADMRLDFKFGRESMQPLWDFLDAYSKQPFYIWFAPSLPHLPHDPPQEYLDQYQGKVLSRAAEVYYANITRFDARVGELLAYLDKHDLRKKTILIYLSDNGYEQDPKSPRLLVGGPHGKASIHEMGFRTPILFSWPGVIAQGRTSDKLVSAVDLYPTCLAFAGVDVPEGRTGYDLKPFLIGTGDFVRERIIGSMDSLKYPGAPRSRPMHRDHSYFLRTAEWRYVWYKDRREEALYRIIDDPLEKTDLSADHPELAKGFRREIEDWASAMSN